MFDLTEEQNKKLEKWLVEQEKLAVEIQKNEKQKGVEIYDNIFAQQDWESGHPYTGAIGGSLTYSFTPTSIGEVIKVQHNVTHNIIDLSSYEDW